VVLRDEMRFINRYQNLLYENYKVYSIKDLEIHRYKKIRIFRYFQNLRGFKYEFRETFSKEYVYIFAYSLISQIIRNFGEFFRIFRNLFYADIKNLR
jgi:hypothetical protein